MPDPKLQLTVRGALGTGEPLPVPLQLITIAILSAGLWALLLWAASCVGEVVS